MKSAAAISRQLQSQRQKLHKHPVKKISKVNSGAHHHGGTSTTAGSPSSTMPAHHHHPRYHRPPGPYRDTMGLHATWSRKKGFTMAALKGKVTVHCIWAACKAMSIGIVFIAIGACLMAVGLYADQLSIRSESIVNGTVVVTRDHLKHYHLSNMSYVGPIVMGIGGFVILAACVMTFESREAASKIVPIKPKKRTVENSRVHMSLNNVDGNDSPTIDFSKAFANLNRTALTSAFIQFSGSFPNENNGKNTIAESSTNFDDKTNLISKKSPSEPVIGRPCYICQDPEKALNHCTNCHQFRDSITCENCEKITVIRRSLSIDNYKLEGFAQTIALSKRGLHHNSSGAKTNESAVVVEAKKTTPAAATATTSASKRRKKVTAEEFPLLDGIVPMAEQEEEDDDEQEENIRRPNANAMKKTSSEDSVPMDVLLADCSITVKVTVEPHGDDHDTAHEIGRAKSKPSGQVRPHSLGSRNRRTNGSVVTTVTRKCSPGGDSIDFSDDNTESTTDYCDPWGSGHPPRRPVLQPPLISRQLPVNSYPVIRQNPVQPASNVHYKLTRHK